MAKAGFSFAGKVVLVVGGSSGIGRAAARRIADQGARVAVTARRAEQLQQLKAEIVSKGGVCEVFPADAEDEGAAAAVVDQVVATFGRIDLVMLNAGGAPALDMRAMDAAGVKRYMRSNYDVVVNYLFPVLAQMRRQGGGMVMHTNSLAGLLAVPLQGPYCAAKAAAKLLIDSCRIEFAEFGISFVTVYPGFVATEGTADDGMPAPMEISKEQAVDHIMRAISRARADTLFPWRTASLVRFALLLPKTLRERVMRRDLPPLPEAVG